MAINYTQPSFSTGTVTDPTRNALAAVTTARQSLSDMLDRNMKQEALQKAQARQKVLDDRATAEYNNKVSERNALGKFEQGILAPRQTYYGDVNNSKAMEYAKNVELTDPELALQKQGKTTPEIEAKLKAQENLGNMITNNGAGYKETEWQKAQRVAKELDVGNSLAVAKRLYSIKAADVAARDKKETDALKQKNDLLTRYNKVNDDIANLQINKKKYVKGTKNTNSNLYKGDVWTPKAVSDYNEQADKFSPYFSTSWKSVWGDTDAKDARGLATYAQTLHVGPKQLGEILVKYGLGGEERYLDDERLIDPTNPKATPEQTLSKIKTEIDSAYTNNASSGKKGKKGFYYNPEDTSTALKLKREQAAQLKAQMAAIRTDYTDDGKTAQEHSMDKINALAEKYWSQPITGTTNKSGSKSGGNAGTSGKSAKEVISGAIDKAVNSPKGGELAKLVAEKPKQKIPFDATTIFNDLGYNPNEVIITNDGRIKYPNRRGNGSHDITDRINSKTTEIKQKLKELSTIDNSSIKNMNTSKLKNMLQLSKKYPKQIDTNLIEKLKQEINKRSSNSIQRHRGILK